MPEEVEKCVEKLLKSKTFYPKKSEDERKRIAYAICYKRQTRNVRYIRDV